MPVYVIAGLPVEYDCKYPLLKNRSEKYKAKDGTEPLFKIELDENFYAEKRAEFPTVSDEIQEYMSTGAFFYKEMLRFDGVMLHASAVAVDGYAYLFSAPCGTGKSTHTKMWQKLFGKDRAVIINDDKPAIRKVDGVYYAFGTPFSGKHDISENACYPIKGIGFLRRSSENSIHKLAPDVAMVPFFNQTIRPQEEDKMDLLCKNADDILKNISFYALDCRADTDAAQTAYNMMKGGENDEN
ncbi:MAG: hypothetical protein MJ120_04565 [Clostridia bacterium]|nr:hypothetical protein [Clostridia bacterium]